MTDGARIDMILYTGLSQHEEDRLRALEPNVMRLLEDHGIRNRAVWTTFGVDERRSLVFCVPGDLLPKVLYKMPSHRFEDLSGEDLLTGIDEALEKAD